MTENDMKTVEHKHRHRTTLQKVVETGFLSSTWLALGLFLEIFGPTLKDLKIKTNSSYEDVAGAVSARGIGLFAGCVVGGVLVDRFGQFCHLFLALSLNLAAAVTVAVPWSPDVHILTLCCAVGGVAETVINVAGQRLILNIWQEKSASPMHLLHAGYGIGSFIVPLYSNPFLAVPMPTQGTNLTNFTTGSMPIIDNETNTSFSNTDLMLTTEAIAYSETSRIEYSYAISASLVTLLSLVFYYYQIRESCIACGETTKIHTLDHTNKTLEHTGTNLKHSETTIGHTEKKLDHNDSKLTHETKQDHTDSTHDPDVVRSRTFREMFNPASCSGGRTWYTIQIFIVLIVYFANAHGGERMVADFIRSFSIDQLGFSKDDGSYLNTTFWISFAVGRFAFFFAARWIGIRKLVLVETGGITLTAILMNIFAVNNTMAYWVLVQPLGFFVAPLWPSMMAWTDHHIELTGAGMALCLLGAAVGGIAHLRLIGYLYDHLGSKTFLYQLVGYGILALVLATILDIIGSQHGNRFKWKTEKKNDEPEVNSDHVTTKF